MFATVTIEPQGRIKDSMLGGGGAIFKTKYFHASAEGAKPCWGGRYELGTLSNTKNNSNLYSGRSNEYES